MFFIFLILSSLLSAFITCLCPVCLLLSASWWLLTIGFVNPWVLTQAWQFSLSEAHFFLKLNQIPKTFPSYILQITAYTRGKKLTHALERKYSWPHMVEPNTETRTALSLAVHFFLSGPYHCTSDPYWRVLNLHPVGAHPALPLFGFCAQWLCMRGDTGLKPPGSCHVNLWSSNQTFYYEPRLT